MIYIFTFISLAALLIHHWGGTLDRTTLWSMFWLNVGLWAYVAYFGAPAAP